MDVKTTFDTTEIVLFILGALLTIIGSMSVFILNAIKDEIKEMKDNMAEINKDMREGVMGLDRRVTKIESQCGIDIPHRRTNNGD